jgi:hypothetical protein
MKFTPLLLCLFLTSCVSAPTGQGSRLLPWNWFHPDANAKLANATTRENNAEDAAVHTAHTESRKAELALEGAGDSASVAAARRFLGNSNGLLAQVSPLTATEETTARKIVSGLLSGSAEFIPAAEKLQATAEKTAGKQSREIEAANAAIVEAQGKLASANAVNMASAEKYRRLWFLIWCIIGGWLLLQLLSGIARFYPTFGPIARVAGFLSAPAVQASYERVTKAISTAVVDAEKAGSAVAENLRSHLDGPLDEAEKKVIHAKVLTAKKKAAAAANA